MPRASEMERKIMGGFHRDSDPAVLGKIGIAACTDKVDEIAGYDGYTGSTVRDANDLDKL